MHHNVIRFDTAPPRELTLIARGTIWPIGVLIDGEYWERTEAVEHEDGRSIRVYVHSRKQEAR